MDLNVKSLATAAIFVTIAALLSVTVLVPIVSEAQQVAGDPITVANTVATPTADYTDRDFEIIAYPSNQADGYAIYVNETGFEKPTGTRFCLISDNLRIGASSAVNRTFEVRAITNGGEWKSFNDSSVVTVQYDASSKVIRYSSTTDTFTVNCEYAFVWDPAGAYGEVLSEGSYPSKIFSKSALDANTDGVYEWAGQITLGDTSVEAILSYTKYGLIAHMNQDVDWTVSFDRGDLTKVSGTTDLYSGLTPRFLVSDGDNTQELVAQRAYILTEAVGHKDSGASYSLIGLVPLLVLAGLVIGVVGSFIRNRD